MVNRTIVRMLPYVPKPVVRRLAQRYIAGETLADAARAVAELNRQGKLATVDVLGEELRHVDETHAITADYRRLLEEIDERRLAASISVKLTAIGLVLDEDLCEEHLLAILEDARGRGNFVCIDMEDASTTDATLSLYRRVRERGYENVGIVLQAQLRRTLEDARALAPLHPDVRLCKGIYVEPPERAFQGEDEIRESFMHVLAELLQSGSRIAIATHDSSLIRCSRHDLDEAGWSRDRYEFQMLLGVRAAEADKLVRAGEPLRIYVPYGIDWYAYSLRRLQENPRIAGYVTLNALARVVPGWRR
ncbi:MAG: proline dehydrogenase family protein [Gaiellaceae bacterium]